MQGLTEDRFYRSWSGGEDVAFKVKVETTDLYIRAKTDLTREATEAVVRTRGALERHIAERPEFATSLKPLELPEEHSGLPPFILSMYRAGIIARVGPMAAVAGTVSREVAEALAPHSSRVLVENGGDLYCDADREVTIAIYAGDSKLSGRIGIKLAPEKLPLAVCTSAGLVGPSLSYGRAQAATVICPDAALADAAATELGNRIKKASELGTALEWAVSLEGVVGALAIAEDNLGMMGDVELVKL